MCKSTKPKASNMDAVGGNKRMYEPNERTSVENLHHDIINVYKLNITALTFDTSDSDCKSTQTQKEQSIEGVKSGKLQVLTRRHT